MTLAGEAASAKSTILATGIVARTLWIPPAFLVDE
jgi:hypothetical protein